jgi:biopolymer transport protein TolR
MALGIPSVRPRGRRRRGGARAPMADINVTPFVDVMLVLLVIFMVTAPMLKAGIPLDLPDSRAKPLDQTPKQVTISLDRDGKVFLDDAELAPGELPDRVAALPPGKDGKPPLIVLRADRALDYGRVANLMGELNRAGVTQISLVTTAEGVAPAKAAVTTRSAADE